MVKKVKKNGYEPFKTTTQGRGNMNFYEMFAMFVMVKFALTLERAEQIRSTFYDRVAELINGWMAECSTIKTIEVATLGNARTMSMSDAYEISDGCWAKLDNNGEPVQVLVEDFELIPPLTRKELDFFNWAVAGGEVYPLPIYDGYRIHTIVVDNNYPESVIFDIA